MSIYSPLKTSNYTQYNHQGVQILIVYAVHLEGYTDNVVTIYEIREHFEGHTGNLRNYI